MNKRREIMVYTRMKKEEAELLKKITEARGEDVSDFVRRAIYKELASLSYLPEDQKKALGMHED